jgi:predicted amidohydrolase
MEKLKIATAQFEHRSADKSYNLSMIKQLTAKASGLGAQVIAFHECSITGYTFARRLSRVNDRAGGTCSQGPSVAKLIAYAREYDIAILAGLFERGADGKLYKAQVCVDKNGLIASHRKLHPFINPYLTPGNAYTVFNLYGWNCGILTCYDNNVIENVRATALLGANIIFMPHVTMCTPSPRPGAGFVDPELWKDKTTNSELLHQEFDGLKGRAWLMKWLPARAYDNAIYAVFSNAIGMDDDQLKNGPSMILDPYGDILAECRDLGNAITIAEVTPDKLTKAGGYRYRMARRPDLYKEIIGKPHQSEQKVVWLQ